MNAKSLIIYIPVIHKGYLDFLDRMRGEASNIYIIDEKILPSLTEFKPDIAAMGAKTVLGLLQKLGFENVSILSESNINSLRGKDLIFIQDEVSRNLYDKYLKGNNVEWKSVFLRWDKSKVLAQQNLGDIPVSSDAFDVEMMNQASAEAEKTGDWWRQIGAVLVKDREILLKSYNKDLPSDYTPYQVGEVRDFFAAGERPEFANTIHSEQDIIAKAAKQGISLEGAALYVTTFPCPVCAKLIARSGIKNLYFASGWSNFDAKKVLESSDIKVICVPLTLK